MVVRVFNEHYDTNPDCVTVGVFCVIYSCFAFTWLKFDFFYLEKMSDVGNTEEQVAVLLSGGHSRHVTPCLKWKERPLAHTQFLCSSIFLFLVVFKHRVHRFYVFIIFCRTCTFISVVL